MNYSKSIQVVRRGALAANKVPRPRTRKSREARTNLSGRALLGIATIIVLAGNATALHAASLKTLHVFPSSGAYRPYAALVQDPGSGNVYGTTRSEEHTSELQSHSFISYA